MLCNIFDEDIFSLLLLPFSQWCSLYFFSFVLLSFSCLSILRLLFFLFKFFFYSFYVSPTNLDPSPFVLLLFLYILVFLIPFYLIYFYFIMAVFILSSIYPTILPFILFLLSSSYYRLHLHCPSTVLPSNFFLLSLFFCEISLFFDCIFQLF